MNEIVLLLSTGGTIDEVEADPVTGWSRLFGGNIPKMVAETGEADVHTEQLFAKESLAITDEDRTLILERCRSCPENRIVITHGTNTMVETAKFVAEYAKNKTIVFVGAFVPYGREHSDAVPNLKFAIANARTLPPGVYIAMNGQAFPWNDVKKSKEKQIFENLKKQ